MDLPSYLLDTPTIENLLPPAIEKLHDLPFEEIQWENFERLSLQLAKEHTEVVGARPYGVQGDTQKGIDIFAYNEKRRLIVYQCKNEQGFSAGKIKQAVQKFIDGDWTTECDEFVLCTRESLQKKERANEIKAQTNLLADKNVTFTVWDSVELNTKLKRHPQLVYDYFGIHWFYAFCGWEQLKLIKLDYPIPAKQKYEQPNNYLPRTVANLNADTFAAFFESEKTLFDAFQAHRKVALLAWGLNGKSFEMENLAAILAEKEAYHPHLIRLSNYADEPLESLIKSIEHIPQDSLCILIDGLDEALPDDLPKVQRRINRFADDYPLARIVVSCRTNYYTAYGEDNSSDTLKGFEAFSLNYWSYEEILRHISSILQDKADPFLSAVNQRQLFDLLRLPFYLLKLSAQYQSNGTIVNSKAEIFEEETKTLIKNEVKRAYDKEHDLKEMMLYNLLAKLAFVMEASGTNFIDNKGLQLVVPDQGDRGAVVGAASIFYGTGTDKKTWRFHHHNTQEYLAAKVLAQRSIWELKKITGIAPEYTKIRPSWYDTILFLFGMLEQENQLKGDLLKWLIEANKELAIKLEPKDVIESVRVNLFKRIFNQYKKEQRRINSQLYRYQELATFSASAPVFDFLLNELDTSKEINNLANAMEILSEVDIQQFPAYYDKFQLAFKDALFGNINELHYSALLGYTEHYSLSHDELKPLFDQFINSSHDLIRPQLFRTVRRTDLTERFTDEIISHVLLIIDEERKRFQLQYHSSRIGTEYGEVARCLEKFQSSESLIKLLDGLGDNFLSFVQLTYFEGTLPILLSHISANNQNSDLQRKVIDLFKANHTYLLNDLKASNAFLNFFKTNTLTEEIAAELCEELDEYNASAINSVSILAAKGTIDLLYEKKKGGRVSDKLVDSLNYFLEKNQNPAWSYFKILFTIPEPVKKPVRDYEKVEEERHLRDLQALFDEEKFKQEVNLIFDGFGKDDISYSDLDYSQPDYWSEKYCSIVREILELRPNSGAINRAIVLENIDHNWPVHFFVRIYNYLAKNPRAVITDLQKSKILNWCDLQAVTVKFSSSIKQHNPYQWTLDENAVMLSFFIRKFDLYHYPEQLYLDMLSFIKYGDDLENIIPFVEKVPGIKSAHIASMILINLAKGVKNSMLFTNYTEYIRDKKLTDGAPLLISYLFDETTPDRYPILKLYRELLGNLTGIEKPFVEMNDKDEFKIAIIEAFVEGRSAFIIRYLKQRFKKEKDTKAKFILASHLTRLSDPGGTKFYLDAVKKGGYVNSNNSENNPLLYIRLTRYISDILYVIKFSKEIPRDAFPGHDLRAIALRALQNIILHDNQYALGETKIRWWIYKEQLQRRFRRAYDYRPNVIALIRLYLESVMKQYLMNRGKNLTIEEALEIYTSFSYVNSTHGNI